jgi:hypothetical protein
MKEGVVHFIIYSEAIITHRPIFNYIEGYTFFQTVKTWYNFSIHTQSHTCSVIKYMEMRNVHAMIVAQGVLRHFVCLSIYKIWHPSVLAISKSVDLPFP